MVASCSETTRPRRYPLQQRESVRCAKSWRVLSVHGRKRVPWPYRCRACIRHFGVGCRERPRGQGKSFRSTWRCLTKVAAMSLSTWKWKARPDRYFTWDRWPRTFTPRSAGGQRPTHPHGDADGSRVGLDQGLNAKLETEVIALRAELAAIRSLLSQERTPRPVDLPTLHERPVATCAPAERDRRHDESVVLHPLRLRLRAPA